MKGILSTTDLDDASLVAKARRPAPGWSAATWPARSCPTAPTRLGAGLRRAPFARPTRTADGRRRTADRRAARRRARLRHEVEHPPPPGRDRLPGDGRARLAPRRGDPGAPARRHLPLQRPRRPPAARRGRSQTLRTLIARPPSRAASRSSASAWAISSSARPSAAKTFKLKFGHRGANHPVRNERTGQGRDHHPEPRLRRRSQPPSPPTSSPATSTSTTRPSKACATRDCPSSASSTTPKPPPAPTTASTSSTSSARWIG